MFVEWLVRTLSWVWLIVVFVAVLLAAAYFDQLGSAAGEAARDALSSFSAFYERHKQLFDYLFLKSSILAAASYALYRWAISTDRILARLLAKFIAKNDARFQEGRERLLYSILPAGDRAALVPARIFVGPLDRAFKATGFMKSSRAEVTNEKSIELAQQQLETALSHAQTLTIQKSTAHIVQGLIQIAKADTWRGSDVEKTSILNAAEQQFGLAIETNPDDFEAFELRALLRMRRRAINEADTDFEEMRKAAARKGMQLAEARAQRHLADLELDEGTQASAGRAREHAESGVNVLTNLQERRALETEERLELARLNLLLTKIFTKPMKRQLFRDSLDLGRSALSGLNSNVAKRLVEEFKKVERRETDDS